MRPSRLCAGGRAGAAGKPDGQAGRRQARARPGQGRADESRASRGEARRRQGRGGAAAPPPGCPSPRPSRRRAAPAARGEPSTSRATTRPSPRCATLPCRGEDAAQPARGDRGRRRRQARRRPGRCATRSADPAARKLVDWYLYRGGYGTAAEIRAFLDANPGLARPRACSPSAPRRRCSTARPARARSRRSSPTASRATAVGLAALASAHLADKDEARAKALAAKAWTEHDICRPAWSRPSCKRVGSLLTEADHKRRLDRLLLNDSRWTGERNERAAVIRRVHRRCCRSRREEEGGSAACRVPARQELRSSCSPSCRPHGAGRLGPRRAEGAGAAPAEEGRGGLEDPAGRARGDRRSSSPTAGGRSGAPTPMRRSGSASPRWPTSWCATPGRSPSTPARTRPSWPAGWRCATCDDAKLALGHFEALAKAADGPLSHARGHYWLGRTHEALGDKAKAQEHYRAASAYFDTFHGQLARLKLDPGASGLKIAPPAAPTAEEIARFNGSDAVKAAVIARKAGLDISAGARLPQPPALPPEERGGGGHARAPGRGAGRHADVGAHRQDRHRARHEPRLLRLSRSTRCRPTRRCASRPSRPSSSASRARRASSTR